MTAATRLQATQFCGVPQSIAGRGRDRPWCTRTSRAPILIRFPTTKNSTKHPNCESRRRIRTPFPNSGSFWCVRASSTRRNLEGLEAEADREVQEATDKVTLRQFSLERIDSY